MINREEVVAGNRTDWRHWLDNNHTTSASVWLVIYKKDSGIPSVNYEEAVEEALCFGWIDSKPNKRDDKSYRQLFSPRSPKSNWSRKNKQSVDRLMKAGQMMPPGLEMVKLAKENGTWDALNDVEDMVVPADLKKALNAYPQAYNNFQAFPPSVIRGILQWILNAKRPETREKRIAETARMANENRRANQYRK